jgi:hypothetical protein
MREASEQMESPQRSQTAQAKNSESAAFLGHMERFEAMSKGIAGLS